MKKFIYIILLIMSMMTMYYFSSQDIATSTMQSNVAIKIIDKVREKVTLEDERLIKLKDIVINRLRKFDKSIVVRKLAHFFMYSIIGGLMMIVIYLFSKKVLISALLSFILVIIFAVFDEIGQLNIYGRSGTLIDVFIDGSGAFFSIVILSIIFTVGKMIRHNLIQSHGKLIS